MPAPERMFAIMPAAMLALAPLCAGAGVGVGVAEGKEPLLNIPPPVDQPLDAPELKTDIQDCRRCWCDTCGRLEECEKHRDGTQPDGLRPLPCIGCVNGLRFKPKEEKPCEEYTEAAGFNNG